GSATGGERLGARLRPRSGRRPGRRPVSVFFFSSRRRHTRSVSAFLLNRFPIYFTNDQIKEMTRKVSAEVDLVHQQTQNQRYGSSHIGATAKDISNVVTDAASGVVDIFH